MNDSTAKPRALILRTAGINCDGELAHAFELAGASTEFIHLNSILESPEEFDRFDLIGLPGGFSYGDDVSGGAIFAMLVRERMYPALRRCIVERGTPIFAPCNGFQVAAKVGLLPGPATSDEWPTDAPPRQSITLTDNIAGRFIDDWVRIETNPDSPCIWTKGLRGTADTMLLPIAHGEGRFVTDDETLTRIESSNLVALRYAESDNVNGSANRIAGICDASGLLFGLMPHPERFTSWTHHPFWTRLDAETTKSSETIGLQMFKNAVEYAKANLVQV